MTVVCINAVSIREGGALVVLRELLSRMTAKRPSWVWHVATNEQAFRTISDMEGVVYHVYPNAVINGIRVRWWYEFELPRLIKSCRADVLFSQTNYLPIRSLRCPSLLLVQHAGHFSEVFKHLTEQRLDTLGRLMWRMKGRWVSSSVLRADRVTVQTHALADCIQSATFLPLDRLIVIPHGTGLAVAHDQRNARLPEACKTIRIGYISKFGVQKNFIVLFRAARILKAMNIDCRIVLTLDPSFAEAREVLEVANQIGVSEIIENHGELESVSIDALYRTLNVFVFPSLCESFGFPLLEAMAYGLPLVAADTPSNAEVTGNAGVLFAPDDEYALALQLKKIIQDDAWFKDRSRASLDRALFFSWDKSAINTISAMEHLLFPTKAES